MYSYEFVGMPKQGAPYGEYRKSKGLGMALGIVASVVTMGAAAPMLASTVLATQIAGGAMFAGGVLSGIGAITGNTKLSKIGAVMSIAGGLGGMVSNSLSASSVAAEAAGEAGSGSAAAASESGSASVFEAGSGSEAVSTFGKNTQDAFSSVFGTPASTASTASDAATPATEAGGATSAADTTIDVTNVAPDGTPIGAGAPTTAATTTTAAPAAAAEKGLLGRAYEGVKDFAGSELGKQTITGAMKMAGEGYFKMQEDEAKQSYYDATTRMANTQADALAYKTELEKLSQQNRNTIPIALDPKDPNYATKKAQAQAQGFKTFDLSTFQSAKPITPTYNTGS